MVHLRPRYMSGWIPRVKGYSPGSPRRSSRFGSTSESWYACFTSMPESVKRRSSSGPTIGAMLGFWSGAVAMGAPRIRFSFVSDAVKILLALVALMWAVEVVDVAADLQLDQYGIEAREPDGLDGIATAPFLHV